MASVMLVLHESDPNLGASGDISEIFIGRNFKQVNRQNSRHFFISLISSLIPTKRSK